MKKRKFILILVLFITVKWVFGQSEIVLEDYFRTLKSLKVEITGETYDFLFDTGGGVTIVSPKIIEKTDNTLMGIVLDIE